MEGTNKEMETSEGQFKYKHRIRQGPVEAQQVFLGVGVGGRRAVEMSLELWEKLCAFSRLLKDTEGESTCISVPRSHSSWDFDPELVTREKGTANAEIRAPLHWEPRATKGYLCEE